jgi:hypothetical protein
MTVKRLDCGLHHRTVGPFPVVSFCLLPRRALLTQATDDSLSKPRVIDRRLSVSGICLDSIHDVGEPWHENREMRRLCNERRILCSWLEIMSHLASENDDGEKPLKVFMATLAGGRLTKDAPAMSVNEI